MLTVLYQAKSQGELDISNRVMYDFYGAGSKAGDTGGGGRWIIRSKSCQNSGITSD